MNLAYLALKEKEPDLNVIEFNEIYVWKTLKRDRVYYSERPLNIDGYYEVDEQKREFIVINSRLIGAEKLRTQLHEMVHHHLDYPITDKLVKMCRSLKVIQTRQDLNAEMLSLVMMFPFPLLDRFIRTGEIPSHLFPYIEERLRILGNQEI